VEVFESFGIVEELLREAYHVLEVTFWNPDGKGGGIVRTRSAADTAPGLSHQPHVILNQARINGLLLEAMKRFNGQEVDYGYRVVDVKVDEENVGGPNAHPVTVRTEKDGKTEFFEAKYVLVSFITVISIITHVSRVVTEHTVLFEDRLVSK
jgi:phenol 2-monooxygenase